MYIILEIYWIYCISYNGYIYGTQTLQETAQATCVTLKYEAMSPLPIHTLECVFLLRLRSQTQTQT